METCQGNFGGKVSQQSTIYLSTFGHQAKSAYLGKSAKRITHIFTWEDVQKNSEEKKTMAFFQCLHIDSQNFYDHLTQIHWFDLISESRAPSIKREGTLIGMRNIIH